MLTGEEYDELVVGIEAIPDERFNKRRLIKAVTRFAKALAERHDPMEDLINANRDEILRKHQEAINLIRDACYGGGIDRIKLILHVLSTFHPMHAESWKGWPE